MDFKRGDRVSFYDYCGTQSGTVVEATDSFAKVQVGILVKTIPTCLLQISIGDPITPLALNAE